MGYLDTQLGIKTVTGLTKYLKEQTHADVEAVKVANSVRIFWAANNTLHKFDISASVIYVVQVEDVEAAITKIKSTLEW